MIYVYRRLSTTLANCVSELNCTLEVVQVKPPMITSIGIAVARAAVIIIVVAITIVVIAITKNELEYDYNDVINSAATGSRILITVNKRYLMIVLFYLGGGSQVKPPMIKSIGIAVARAAVIIVMVAIAIAVVATTKNEFEYDYDDEIDSAATGSRILITV